MKWQRQLEFDEVTIDINTSARKERADMNFRTSPTIFSSVCAHYCSEISLRDRKLDRISRTPVRISRLLD